MLKVGIVGLPNSGKSTLFNALLQRQIAEVAEYPFTTIKPNVGVVQVPDPRLQAVSKATAIEKVVPAAVEFIDIAGLVKGAHTGEGLGNQFLGHIREVDAILHLVRGFHNPKVPGNLNPSEDIQIVNEELKYAEIAKPTIYILNIDEAKINASEAEVMVSEIRKLTNQPAIYISAKLESELQELSAEEQTAYLKELGIHQPSLEKIIKESFCLLDLITFFTVAHATQVQAWPLRNGETALSASGLVHTDMQKGFIKALAIDWKKLVAAGSWKVALEKGWIRLEGRDYEVSDGDAIEFKFNV